jgi:hypothetical protein
MNHCFTPAGSFRTVMRLCSMCMSAHIASRLFHYISIVANDIFWLHDDCTTSCVIEIFWFSFSHCVLPPVLFQVFQTVRCGSMQRLADTPKGVLCVAATCPSMAHNTMDPLTCRKCAWRRRFTRFADLCSDVPELRKNPSNWDRVASWIKGFRHQPLSCARAADRRPHQRIGGPVPEKSSSSD